MCMFFITVRDIWGVVRQTYSKIQDASQIYEIKTKITVTKQGSLSIIEYLNMMKRLWLELDYYATMMQQWHKNFLKERNFEFLLGFNVEYDK